MAGLTIGDSMHSYKAGYSDSTGGIGSAATEWVMATDPDRITREGLWQEASFRYAEIGRAHV